MKTTRALDFFSRLLFFGSVFFITVFFADWFSGPFFFNRNYRALKYFLCFAVPVLTALFNYSREKNLRFIGKSTAVIMSCFVIGLVVFNLKGLYPFSVKEMATLYHLSYALICVFMVFSVATLLAYLNGEGSIGYSAFYNDFFSGYVPMMITLYILFYGVFRYESQEYSVNLVLFQGEIKTVLNDFSTFSVMRTLGNIVFYSTISLTAARFIKKNSALFAFLIPVIISILTETAQGLFSLGDADIDDVVLNSAGALIGALIYKFIIEKVRGKELCSE